MAAAWELTSPDNKGACDVTIFQMGGRLGGKGASSRNVACGERIEEHALHLWLGYYENAFRLIRSCFSELKDLESSEVELKEHLANKPFENWSWLAAFERASLVGLADDSSNDLRPWVARFPEYVPRSENGVNRIYEWDDGTTLPGVHIVDDPKRAYPGEESVVKDGKDCENGEDVCLEQPNVAFFLTHALRELSAFVDSLELRVERIDIQQGAGTPPEDPSALLAQVLNLHPVTHADGSDGESSDILRLLRIARLTFLVPAIQAFATIARITEGPVPFVRDRFVAMLDRYIDTMREKIETVVQADTALRRIWELIDLLAANIRGLVTAGLEGEDDFSSLDEWNYEDWLRMNRIAERTLRNPILRGAYDLGLAYRNGDARDPQIAAGQAINAACRFFFMYKGALFWRLKAGMGDVVFAPLYLALRNRGVKFRFFHRLDDIEVDSTRQRVTKLHFCRQVGLPGDGDNVSTNYKPLVVVAGGRMSAWREQPDSSQFDRETRERYERVVNGQDGETVPNFESVWCNWERDRVFATVGEELPLQGKDPSWIGHYNDVIVTVPVAALGRVSKNLAGADNDAGQRWRNMLNNIGTVATQSVQLWLKKPTRDLGWPHGQVSFSAFVHPFDTWADLSQLIEVENQPAVGSVHYFCSVLPESRVPSILIEHPAPTRAGGDRARVTAALKEVKAYVSENARRFLDDWVFQLWPDAVDRYPNVFKWSLLVDPHERRGAERLNAQHIVANVDPSERYTQSLPGTTKYRIRPNETGFTHLFIAGDWTDCGLNFGCVEAAVISGRLASAGITGSPDTRLIPGYVRPRKRVAAIGGGN